MALFEVNQRSLFIIITSINIIEVIVITIMPIHA